MVTVTKSVFKSLEVLTDDKNLRLDTGMNVRFSTEDGVIKRGILKDIKKKDEKTELIIKPHGEPQEENWKVVDIQENTLTIDKED